MPKKPILPDFGKPRKESSQQGEVGPSRSERISELLNGLADPASSGRRKSCPFCGHQFSLPTRPGGAIINIVSAGAIVLCPKCNKKI